MIFSGTVMMFAKFRTSTVAVNTVSLVGSCQVNPMSDDTVEAAGVSHLTGSFQVTVRWMGRASAVVGEIVGTGAELSTVYVSSAAAGQVDGKAVPDRSSMSWPDAKPSPTSPSKSASAPPEATTS